MKEINNTLEIIGGSKAYGPTVVLKSINTEFRGGELVGLIGANGAGKSTFFNCLTGNSKLSTGSIVLNGELYNPANAISARLSGVVLVPQELIYFPHLSPLENFRIMTALLPNRDLSDKGAQKSRAIGRISLNRFSPSLIQDVILTAAFSAAPKVLLLDEPTALISETEGGELFEKLRSKKSLGTIIIISTHRLADILSLDRWIFLENGQITLDTRCIETAKNKYFCGESGKESEKNEMIFEKKIDGKGSAFIDIEGLSGFSTGRVYGILSHSGDSLLKAAQKMKHDIEKHRCDVTFLGGERKVDCVFSHLTVQEHIEISLGKRSTYRNKLEKLLNFINLPSTRQFFGRQITELSGGTQQKLFLILALLGPGRLKILCDPNRGMDLKSQEKAISIIKSEAENGNILIIFSQDVEFTMKASSEIGFLGADGKLDFQSISSFQSIRKLRERL